MLIQTKIFCLMFGYHVLGSRMPRQVPNPSEERMLTKPPQICCRCINQEASCNNDIANEGTHPGLTCPDMLECDGFGCDDDMGCKVQNTLVLDGDPLLASIVDLKQGNCLSGQKICCNPGPGGGVEKKLGIVSENNPLGEMKVDTRAMCDDSNLLAAQDFGHGVTCGKRDSRVYYEADLEEGFTNPGEWPWAVLIFSNGNYIGAGALMDNDVVATVAHKVKNFVENPSSLTVRLGDWNPNIQDTAEEFPHLEVGVACVKIHPQAELNSTLANNVAVLKLNMGDDFDFSSKLVSDVVNYKRGPKRPANIPEGVEGSSVVKGITLLDTRLGLIDQPVPPPQRSQGAPPSYINTVCLPKSLTQFKNYEDHCWVAAWGQDLKRQREVDLPLLSNSECERRLRPTFQAKGLQNWRMQPSEICAGGIPEKDTCDGEGGAPLVCYDKESDLFFAAGLVNYGFDCYSDKPAVYTNLADPSVKQFIIDAFNSNIC